MVTETIKSTAITNLDAAPPVRGTAGMSGQAGMFTAEAYASVQPSNAVTSPSIYKFVRVPSTAVISAVEVEHDGTVTTFTGDITIFYSDQTLDEVGVGQGNTGLVNSLSGANALFAQAHAFGSDTAGAIVNVTNANLKYPPTARIQALWQAAGLTSDPGGFFDIVVQTTATNSLTAGANVGLRVKFQMPYA